MPFGLGSTKPHHYLEMARVLWENRDNMVITPHIAFNSREAVARILSTTVENVRASLGGTPQNIVTLR